MMKIAGQKSTGTILPIDEARDFEDNSVVNILGSYNFFGIPIESMTVSGNYNHVVVCNMIV